MNRNQVLTRKIVLTSLLAALVVVGSALRITLPVSIGSTTSFHLGNIMCALAGLLLGPWWGALAAAMGSAIYDMLNPLYISEAWITFLTKGAYGLAVGLVILSAKGNWGYLRAVIATITGALTYACLYLSKGFFYDGLLMRKLDWEHAIWAVVDKLPATAFNAAIAIACAPLLAISIRTALKRNHLIS